MTKKTTNMQGPQTKNKEEHVLTEKIEEILPPTNMQGSQTKNKTVEEHVPTEKIEEILPPCTRTVQFFTTVHIFRM
jgi:hypothetical protein